MDRLKNYRFINVWVVERLEKFRFTEEDWQFAVAIKEVKQKRETAKVYQHEIDAIFN